MTGGRRHAEPWPPLYDAGRALVVAWARRVHGFAVAGAGNIAADRGVLVVCNHLADSDGAFVAAAIPAPRRTVNLVTARHHDSPVPVRALLLRLGLEPVRTDGTDVTALRHARNVLRNGGIVVIYPEGVPGFSARVQPFAEGAAWLALTPGIDVVPAAIWGSDRVMQRGLPIGRGPVRVAFGRPVELADLTGRRTERVAGATERLHGRVQGMVSALAATR
jgi:1-acyl-sn-glycerol-3-phosphate acyltransferase